MYLNSMKLSSSILHENFSSNASLLQSRFVPAIKRSEMLFILGCKDGKLVLDIVLSLLNSSGFSQIGDSTSFFGEELIAACMTNLIETKTSFQNGF